MHDSCSSKPSDSAWALLFRRPLPLQRESALFLLVTLSSIGLPGLNGFVGEFLVGDGEAVSALGGTIEIESLPGSGTTARVTLASAEARAA